AEMPEERVEILDPELEGKAERIGFEVSYQLGYQRGGPRRILIAREVQGAGHDANQDRGHGASAAADEEGAARALLYRSYPRGEVPLRVALPPAGRTARGPGSRPR